MKKILPLIIAATVASTQLHAAAAYNGKAMALSGAGVASAHYTYGVLINPANAVHYDASDDGNLSLNVGAILSDEDDLIDNGNDLADQLDLLDPLTTATSTADLQNIVDTLGKLDNADARVAAGANLSIGIPNKHLSAVFYANYVGAVEARALVDPNDITRINALIDGSSTTPINVNDLDSEIRATGVLMTELGVSLAREFDLAGQPVAFGVTPKYQKIETIAYTATVSNFDDDDFDADNFTLEDSNLNLDLGVTTHWDHWYLGGSLSNLIENDYDTVDPTKLVKTVDPTIKVKVETKATVGGSYKNGWGMASLDLDLNSTQYLGTQDNVQFVRVGAELNAWNTVQLRVGYRHDLENTLDDTISAGLGLSPWGVVNLDVAVLAGENETLGAAVQLGVSF